MNQRSDSNTNNYYLHFIRPTLDSREAMQTKCSMCMVLVMTSCAVWIAANNSDNNYDVPKTKYTTAVVPTTDTIAKITTKKQTQCSRDCCKANNCSRWFSADYYKGNINAKLASISHCTNAGQSKRITEFKVKVCGHAHRYGRTKMTLDSMVPVVATASYGRIWPLGRWEYENIASVSGHTGTNQYIGALTR